jgi:hypothetical protein
VPKTGHEAVTTPLDASPGPSVDTTPDAATAVPSSRSAVPSCKRTLVCKPAPAETFVSIALERTACHGECPVYTVTLKRDGSVAWNGSNFVDAVGPRAGKADPSETRALFELIAKSCYTAMDDEYSLGPTDHPWANTVLITSAGSKSVRHYAPDDPTLADSAPVDSTPPQCVAPDSLTEIENRIDTVARSATFIGKHRR